MPPEDNHVCVLRARIGLDYPSSVTRTDVADRLAGAIAAAVEALGGRLDVLQLDLAARPDWDQFGPINRVTGDPLWVRPPATD